MTDINKELLRKTINQICQNPETWDQSQWHCGTSHCFAGWGEVLAGFEESDLGYYEMVEKMGREFGIPKDLSFWLFDEDRILFELHRTVKLLLEDKYDFNLEPDDQDYEYDFEVL